MPYVTIDWTTVRISAVAHELFDMAVHLEGSPDETWRRAFNALMDDFVNRDAADHLGADWTVAPVADEYVHVGGVRPGQEQDVKDKLELVVDRANAHSAARRHEADAAEQAAQADAMARRFRGDE
jgi:hypothetical protein